MPDKTQELQALQIALQTEEEGFQLYKNARSNASNEFTRSLFDQLMKDELMHKDLIKRFYAGLKESGSWSELSDADINYQGSKSKIKTIFSSALDEAKKGEISFTDTDVAAYKKASQFEKDGVELYERLYNEIDDESAKNFYSFLREMEREHMDMLDKAHQYLNDPGNFYLQEEGWTLDD